MTKQVRTVPLSRIAMARSGDKGEGSNVGVIARSQVAYDFLVRELTSERVRAHMAAINRGEVRRYEAPNLLALNFLLQDSLGGGGSASLKRCVPQAGQKRRCMAEPLSATERKSEVAPETFTASLR